MLWRFYSIFDLKSLLEGLKNSPPRISQISQSAEIPQRKLSEILTEFLGRASVFHQNIPTEISLRNFCKEEDIRNSRWNIHYF